jgi:hypothetical protein
MTTMRRDNLRRPPNLVYAQTNAVPLATLDEPGPVDGVCLPCDGGALGRGAALQFDEPAWVGPASVWFLG